MIKKMMTVMGLMLICVSLMLIYGPYISAWMQDRTFEEQIEQVASDSSDGQSVASEQEDTPAQNEAESGSDDNGADISSDDISPTDAEYRARLLDAMEAYNRRIYEEGQSGITGLQSFEQIPEELTAYADACIGYVEIPSIDVKLPLYIGADATHLDLGAAVLSQTSMPTGGINTNCVIAGHRGWKSSKYFKDIEEIQIGDLVYVANPTEKLTYVVTSIDIIDPDASDAILIQEGKDMVTLLTCHPYMSGGRYRYAVYCQRDTSLENLSETEVSAQVDEDSGLIHALNGEDFESSENQIQLEDELRLAAAVLVPILLILSLLIRKRGKHET